MIFCKLWDDQGDIPWWLAIFFPWLAMTRILVETMHDVVVKMPLTEFGQLGYGADGTAYEYAFSAPADDDLDRGRGRGQVPATRGQGSRHGRRPSHASAASSSLSARHSAALRVRDVVHARGWKPGG